MRFEKIKKIIIAYIANNFKLSNKLTRVQKQLSSQIEALKTDLQKALESQGKFIDTKFAESKKQFLSLDSQFNEIQTQTLENEMLLLSKFIATKEELESKNKLIAKNHFLLLDYNKHIPRHEHFNLGDYVQTIATHYALSNLFPNATYKYHDRDCLTIFATSKATTSAGGGD